MLVPSGNVTDTVTLWAAGDAGVITRISVSETTVKLAADIAPKFTPLAPVKPPPRKVTIVPPRRGPDGGSTVTDALPDTVAPATTPSLGWNVPPAVVGGAGAA